MGHGTLNVLSALLALPAWSQDEKKDDAKARRALLNDLSKQLRSFDEGVRLDTIDELANVDDSKARSMLAKKLISDTEKVRLAAAKALVKHKHAYCADALGNGIKANFKHDRIVTGYVDALTELDMCAGIKVLLMILKSNPKQGIGALDGLVKIGCPEAVQPLVIYLKQAETEEKKPDFFQPIQTGNNTFARNRFKQGPIPNKTKDKDVAKLAPKVRSTLEALSGQKFNAYKDWFAASRSGKLRRKLVSIYRCSTEGKTFELATGKRPKCPYGSGKSGHKDTLLKHRPE